MDLAALADTRAGELPYGHKRALELATTLAADPAVMLLDEPTQGTRYRGSRSNYRSDQAVCGAAYGVHG